LKSLIKLSVKLLFTVVSLIALSYFTWIYIYPRLVEKESRQSELHFIKRVIDGDTFETENGLKVRLLGVDTPEKYESKKLDSDAERTAQDKETIKKLGELASEYAAKLVLNKRVKLVPEPNHEDKDRYGRLLRYVYLEDGTDVNKKMIADGYAYAFRNYKISRLDEFIEAERQARLGKRGLWGKIDGLKQFE